MARPMCFAAAALGVAMLVPGSAYAGTVTRDAEKITYTAAADAGAREQVVVGDESGRAFVTSERGATTSSCDQPDPMRAECDLTPAFVVFLLGFDDSLSTSVSNGAKLEAHGGAGADEIDATPNADRLFGDEGGDRLVGGAGADTLDGGPGDDYMDDGTGDDAVIGGPGSDNLTAGGGRDPFTGGDGSDTVDYGSRTAALTITLDAQADDGEAGEGDNVAADVENAFGGSGNDRIVGTGQANELRGGAGNDSIVAGAGGDRVEGNEGDDTIDTRDGEYDSVDCGAGNDTVFGDPGDTTTACEVAPDPDGDGSLAPADCAPNDPAVHPGAGEVFGNAIDEDCLNGPGYLRVVNPIAYSLQRKRHPTRVRFRTMVISEVRAGDRIEIRCRGKGCPFKRKTVAGRAGSSRVDVARLLKRRYLRAGAVLEIRILRANEIGKVQQFRISRSGAVKNTGRCLPPGATAPARCG